MNFVEIGGYKVAEMTTNSIVTEDVAAVSITVELDDDLYGHAATFTATGSSKRHPSDPSDEALGEALALSRALASLSEQLAVYSTVKIDEIQEEKALRKDAERRLNYLFTNRKDSIVTIPVGAGLDR